MKYMIVFLFLLSGSLIAKENVLVAFGRQGNLNTTANLSNHGVQLAIKMQLKPEVDLEFIFVDIGDSVLDTAKAINKGIASHKPIAIIGAITSNKAFVISDIAEKEKILFITPYATNPILTKDKNFTYRTCFDDNYQGEMLAKFVKNDLKLKKGISLVNKKMSYALSISEIFGNEIRKSGGSHRSLMFTDPNSILPEHKETLMKEKPDFIFLPSYQIEAANIISSLGKLLPGTTFIGPDSWGGGRMFHNIMKTSGTKFVGYYSQHWSFEHESKKNNEIKKVLGSELVDKKLRFSSTSMNAPIAIGYELADFLIKLYVYAATEKKTITEAIDSFAYQSISGEINLGNPDKTAKKPIFIYKITNTTEEYLKGYK